MIYRLGIKQRYTEKSSGKISRNGFTENTLGMIFPMVVSVTVQGAGRHG